MTHEYVIALSGLVLASDPQAGSLATAIAWAKDRVLAVGSDDIVRSISRGDSVFIDLDGHIVTPAPKDVRAAEQLMRDRASITTPFETIGALHRAGLLGLEDMIEPGVRADLAFWSTDPGALMHIVAIVRAGAFTIGDEHRGPFALAASVPS